LRSFLKLRINLRQHKSEEIQSFAIRLTTLLIKKLDYYPQNMREALAQALDQDSICAFLVGLRDQNMSDIVRRANPSTYKQAVEIARLEELSDINKSRVSKSDYKHYVRCAEQRRKRESSSGSSRSRSRSKERNESREGRNRSWSQSRRGSRKGAPIIAVCNCNECFPSVPTGTRINPVRCHGCNWYGHYKNECPHLKVAERTAKEESSKAAGAHVGPAEQIAWVVQKHYEGMTQPERPNHQAEVLEQPADLMSCGTSTWEKY